MSRQDERLELAGQLLQLAAGQPPPRRRARPYPRGGGVQHALQDIVPLARRAVPGRTLAPARGDDAAHVRAEAPVAPVEHQVGVRGQVRPPDLHRAPVGLLHYGQVEHREDPVAFLVAEVHQRVDNHAQRQVSEFLGQRQRRRRLGAASLAIGCAAAVARIDLAAQRLRRSRAHTHNLVQNVDAEGLHDERALSAPVVPLAGHQPRAQDAQEGLVRKGAILLVVPPRHVGGARVHHLPQQRRLAHDQQVPRGDPDPRHRPAPQHRLLEDLPRAAVLPRQQQRVPYER
mmetsp:Transcript_22195/g.68651  ORF Transcript_22195/g.68651 Transcript_22195/m.68651 type:complete len:287 (-) Transcript_22195:20-880(-)